MSRKKETLQSLVADYTICIRKMTKILANPGKVYLFDIAKLVPTRLKIGRIHKKICQRLEAVGYEPGRKVSAFRILPHLQELSVPGVEELEKELDWHQKFWSKVEVRRAKNDAEIRKLAAKQ